ncbi:hypothetical protein BVRB_042860, partial [Beta vulgaris subsp. vulgaris]
LSSFCRCLLEIAAVAERSEMETTSQSKAAIVRSVLTAISVSYSDLNDSLFRFSLDGLPSCIIRVRDQGIIFYSLYPNRIDTQYRKAVAEFLVRVNFALNFGNFEFNLDDGQVRFKMSVQATQALDLSAPLKSCLILAQEVYPRWVSGIHLV